MNALLIFIWIYAAMIALSFVEAYVEGRNPWDKRKVGWKLKLPGGYPVFRLSLLLIRSYDTFISIPSLSNLWMG